MEYKKYVRMINSISARFAKMYKIDFDEIKAEANLIFCESVNRYDENKGAVFSTYLYSQLNIRIWSYCEKELKRRACQIQCGDMENSEKEEEGFYYFENKVFDLSQKFLFSFLDKLEKDSREVIKTFFTFPEDKMSYANERKPAKKNLYKYFRDKGWSNKRVFVAFDEITLKIKDASCLI